MKKKIVDRISLVNAIDYVKLLLWFIEISIIIKYYHY